MLYTIYTHTRAHGDARSVDHASYALCALEILYSVYTHRRARGNARSIDHTSSYVWSAWRLVRSARYCACFFVFPLFFFPERCSFSPPSAKLLNSLAPQRPRVRIHCRNPCRRKGSSRAREPRSGSEASPRLCFYNVRGSVGASGAKELITFRSQAPSGAPKGLPGTRLEQGRPEHGQSVESIAPAMQNSTPREAKGRPQFCWAAGRGCLSEP